jgi:hypothetical protein
MAKDESYRLQVNDAGQILLDSAVAMPERELWLHRNLEAISSVQRDRQSLHEVALSLTH